MLARWVAVLAAIAVGALTAIGCALAALFEVQGFGTPQDADPRAGLLALYALGVVVGVAGPLVLWRVLVPDTAPAARVVAAVAGLVLVLLLLGIALSG